MNARRVAAEAVGTFFLVFIGPGSAMVNAYSGGALGQVGVAVAFAFVVSAMIYALGHLSGAHINPAVTLAFWSVRRFPAAEVVPYLLAQCTGAVAASLALRVVLGPVGNMGATLPSLPVGAAFGVEWLLSFALMFVIMAVATDERVADGFAALAVGFTVGFCALMGGPLTGADCEGSSAGIPEDMPKMRQRQSSEMISDSWSAARPREADGHRLRAVVSRPWLWSGQQTGQAPEF